MNKILFIILIITIPLVILSAGHLHGQAEDAPIIDDRFEQAIFPSQEQPDPIQQDTVSKCEHLPNVECPEHGDDE